MDTIITLLNSYVTGLLNAEDKFIDDLNEFPVLEKTVADLSNRMAAGFLAACLTTADMLISDSGTRKKDFKIQRQRMRTLISSVGDVSFMHTLYSDPEGHSRCLLDEQIHLPDRERFTTLAEAKVLNEAEVHSYQHAAESITSGAQTITKTTVMNKVHAVEQDLPDPGPASGEKKQLEYLYIEADEDHIHCQKDSENDGCFIGKLIYLFEGKEDICKGRRKLISPFYFGGLYNGTAGNAELWKGVEKYIRDRYDQDYLKCVYISGDGGGWIRSSTDYIYKSRFVTDRFHLMKYIYRVAGFTLDDRETTIGMFYKYIYRNRKQDVISLLDHIQNSCEGSDKAVDDSRKFMLNNWGAIQTAFHDENVIGCSAEGHVSQVYSERMSSRPMGWSGTGSDRMCRLRCFVRNYGRDRIVDLVKYRRNKELGALAATGTEGMIDQPARTVYSADQRRARAYIERIQATLQMNSTVHKTFAIREQIGML